MISRSEFAQKIADFFNSSAKGNFVATVWEKGEKIRVYIKDMGYKNSTAQAQGFIEITKEGVAVESLKRNGTANRISGGWGSFEVMPYSAYAPRLSESEVAAKLAAPRRRGSGNSTTALDAMYGVGGWDARDREDYEG